MRFNGGESRIPWAIVLAGGSGRRLQALAASIVGEPLPKQYCDFGTGQTLLQRTLDRLGAVCPSRRTLVVVDASQRARAAAQLAAHPGVRVVAQPSDRGTAAGVLLPLSEVFRVDPDATVLLAPSDHAFGNESLFRAGIERGRAAVEAGETRVVLFGVKPAGPASDYGWILPGGPDHEGIAAVDAFVEKPPTARAASLLASGGLWNTMILVARAASLLELYRRQLPALSAVFEIGRSLPTEARSEYLERRYPELVPADFSRDLLGRAAGLAVYAWPAEVAWTDLGTPARMLAWLHEGVPAAPGESERGAALISR